MRRWPEHQGHNGIGLQKQHRPANRPLSHVCRGGVRDGRAGWGSGLLKVTARKEQVSSNESFKKLGGKVFYRHGFCFEGETLRVNL